MDRQDEEFQKRLLALFKVEAQEHLNVMAAGLVEMERGGTANPLEIVERIYRESHSLKGAACSVNWSDIVDVCQAMEDVFSALKRKEIVFLPEMKEVLLESVDWLERLIDGEPLTAAGRNHGKELVRRLEETAKGKAALTELKPVVSCKPTAIETEKSHEESVRKTFLASQAETVRIATAKLDVLLLQAEELLAVKAAVRQRSLELRELKKTFELSVKACDSSYRKEPEACRFRPALEKQLAALLKAAEYDNRITAAMVDKLLADIKAALMLPLASQLEFFPRFVRELARELGKQAELIVDAGEIEIDRRVLEEIKDPLLHLLRNAMVHGIESPQDRAAQGKQPCGLVRLTVTSQENMVEISLADDGAGIDLEMVKSEAVRRGVLASHERSGLKESEALNLIFYSEVSTAPLVTDSAGRGLGLAIVQEKIEKLNGLIRVETSKGQGTVFFLKIPISLATFRGLVINVAQRSFILPAEKVERVVRIERKKISSIENSTAVIINDEPLALACLAGVLGLEDQKSRQEEEYCQVAVLRCGERKIGFIVEAILQEQEVLAKPLGKQLLRVRNIAGAAVIGNGKIVPILHVPDLMKSAMAAGGTKEERETPKERKTVLLVDDSITARSMLKNILEAAGYAVLTAVDGADALAVLNGQKVELVVTDVNMPRLDGFMLTERIRAEKSLAKIPVVLVTSLEAKADRERGLEVGANAYIVKSNFEKNGLLAILKRLI